MPPIALERIQTDDNTDTLTQATVQKMCAQIRQSICGHADLSSDSQWTCRACAKQWPMNDPRNGQSVTREMIQAENIPVHQAAAYAKKHFAGGSSDAGALAWAVFWYVKHCVKFRSDEGTMMQVGERALDLLTAPAVLVRMKDPSEDCDGFTELSAALLTILGVPVVITTVAADLDDPRRWSHVFLCAIINGRVMPLDTSHGKAPGWMVPNNRINRWQTWTLDGRPSDIKMPTYRGLHGYVGTGQFWGGPPSVNPGIRRNVRRIVVPRRGMGQACASSTCIVTDPDTGDCTGWDDSSCSTSTTSQGPCPTGQTMIGGICTATGTLNPSAQNCPSGQVDNGSGICIPVASAVNVPLTPTQAGLTAAQQAQLIAAVGNSAVSLIRTAAGGPYTVAGTNLVYNPATGQLTTVAAVNATAGLNLSSLTSNLPLLLGGGLLLLLVMGRK